MTDPYHSYGLAPEDMPPDWEGRLNEVSNALIEALSLLNSVIDHVPSEYEVRPDVMERYEKLKAKYHEEHQIEKQKEENHVTEAST